jgi:SAM-dependent methyltransferase
MAVEKSRQRIYWESRRKRRDPAHPVIARYAAGKIDLIRAHLPGEEGVTMLEVGAGSGTFSAHLDPHFDLTCMDFSPNMLAMNPVASGRKVVGDAEALDFGDDAFDVVFCANLLHHLEDPARAVAEMRRVARRHVVLIEPNALNPAMFLFGALVKEERGTLAFTPNHVTRLCTDAGMTIRLFTSHGAILPNKTPTPLVGLVGALDGPSTFGFYHVVIADA